MLGPIGMLASRVEILVEQRHVVIPVLALMLMPQSHRMADLMRDSTRRASTRRDRDFLCPAHHADMRPAEPGLDIREPQVIGLGRARHE